MISDTINKLLDMTGSGWKTYFSAAGLIGYAVYLASHGHWDQAVQPLLLGLAGFGVRHAITTHGIAP